MTELEKNKRIFEEFLRIGSLFEGLSEKNFILLFPMIRNTAFMVVTLHELEDLINKDGAVDQYMNGSSQYGTKASASLQAYNQLIKNYNATIKVLYSWLPGEQTISVQEQWERKRMSEEELAEVLEAERIEKARTAAEWREKFTQYYNSMVKETEQ